MPPKNDKTGSNAGESSFQSKSQINLDSKSGHKTGKFKLLFPLLLIIAALITAFWIYLINKRDFISTDDAYIDCNKVSISAKMLGRISQLMVNEGDTVQTNQLLVKLDDSDLQAQEEHAKASLSLAQENIKLVRVNMARAQKDYERATAQFHEHIISKEQFEHAQSEYDAVKARTNIAVAQAQTVVAQIGMVETQLNNTRIVSPMDGVVAKRWVMNGDVVQPGQAIFSIYDLKNVWITANLEETRVAALYQNCPVNIKIDAYPHGEFSGKVIHLGSNTAAQFSLIPPNNASGNFTKITQRVPVKISIDQIDTSVSNTIRLLPGMSVNIKAKVR